MIFVKVINQVIALRRLFKPKQIEKITDADKAIDWVSSCIHRGIDIFTKDHGQSYMWYCVIYNPRSIDFYTTRDNEIYTFNAFVIQDANTIIDIVYNINLKILQNEKTNKR